jgi:hypothetical protein
MKSENGVSLKELKNYMTKESIPIDKVRSGLWYAIFSDEIDNGAISTEQLEE